MLIDPLPFPLTAAGASNGSAILNDAISGNVELHTIDFGPGSTVRTGLLDDGTKVTLSIKHSQSNENAPFETGRSLVRIDLERVNATTSKPVKMSVYTLISVPKGPDFTYADAEVWARNLAIFTGFGKASGTDLDSGDDSIARIIAGEP